MSVSLIHYSLLQCMAKIRNILPTLGLWWLLNSNNLWNPDR